MKTIVIGCDNAAVEMKNTIINFVRSLGYEVENMGCDSSDDPTNYPTIAKAVCENIIQSGYEKNGILVCGTGIGMAMTANKFKGIRAAVCHDLVQHFRHGVFVEIAHGFCQCIKIYHL